MSNNTQTGTGLSEAPSTLAQFQQLGAHTAAVAPIERSDFMSAFRDWILQRFVDATQELGELREQQKRDYHFAMAARNSGGRSDELLRDFGVLCLSIMELEREYDCLTRAHAPAMRENGLDFEKSEVSWLWQRWLAGANPEDWWLWK